MAAPIRAFVGPNGGGKTLAAMVMCVAPALREGREVVATTEIDHPKARLLESWREVPSLRGCLLVLDDITSQLPARQAMSVPPQLVRMVNELRHADVELAWTAPNWARADVTVREVTQVVTVCRGFWPDVMVREPVVPPWYRLASRAVRRSDRGWVSNRLFRFTSYDATTFDEFTYHQVKDVRPLSRRWYYRPWQPEQFMYNTLNFSVLLSHLDESGVCLTCGGVRRRTSCTCERRAGEPEAGTAEAERPQSESVGVDTRSRTGPIVGVARGKHVRRPA